MEKKKIILSNGEVTELSQEEVYKKFERLLHKICNNFYMLECFNSDGHNELFSIALIAFVKAFNNYDYTKGATFCSYLGYVTKTGILTEYRLNGIPDEFKPTTEDGKVIKYGNKYSTMTVSETVNSLSEEGESNLFDLIPDYSSEEEINLFLSDEEMKDVFKRVLDTKRNKPFKEAFIDYMNGMRQIDLAEKYNFSQSYLSRKLNAIIKEIKDYYLQSK